MDEQRNDEDQDLIRRLHQAPTRWTYNVDVGGQPHGDAKRLIRDLRRRFRDLRMTNPLSGELDTFSGHSDDRQGS